jgi:hypothetical protein
MTATDINSIVHELARAGEELPREAMQRALDNWDEVAPPLLALLEAHTDGRDRSEDATGAVFFILHLVGQAREQRAFPAICRLAQDPEALEDVLGDGIASTLPAILIGTYDGDLDRLKALIEDEAVDEIVRADAFDALAWLTAAGQVPREAAATYLCELHGALQPRAMSFAWFGWQKAVAVLGLEDFRPLVADAFERGFVDPSVMGLEHFLEDLRAARECADPLALLVSRGIAPLEDAIAELSRWHAFSEEHKRDKAKGADRTTLPLDWDMPQPMTNPLRGIGRNDPCPCGSGKKFKKCCLH